MAKARKLKSGNWNIQVFDYRDAQGKLHFTSFTAPTKYEVEFKAAQYKKDHPVRTANQDLTVGDAVDRYIELCGTLSPTTTTAYKKVRQFAFQGLMNTSVKRLTPEVVQRAINEESQRPQKQTGKPISAKTVHNEWALVAAALKKICGEVYEVALPRIQRQIKQYPDPKLVLEAIMESSVVLPCLLAMWCTFSMSEILGLKTSSIKDGCIFINQVKVYTDQGFIEKGIAKNTTRNRAQRLPAYILRLIEESDSYKEYKSTGVDRPLIPLSRDTIYDRWTKAAKKKSLELSFHDLRHMSASIMLQLNIPEKYAQERGGWATPHVMRTVYQHTFTAQRLAVDAIIDEYFEKSLNE